MLEGIVPPIVTPLDSQGNVDLECTGYVTTYIAPHAQGLFCLGTTGECVGIRDKNRKNLLCRVMECADNTPVYAGVIAESTASARHEIERLQRININTVVVTLPPYAFLCTEQEQLRHFRAIADLGVWVILYNIPQRTNGREILLSVAGELALDPRFIGIMDSSGKWRYLRKLIREVQNEHFSVMCGAQPLATKAMLAGARGVVPSTANFAPRDWERWYRAVRSENTQRIERWRLKVDGHLQIFLPGYSEVAMIKEALRQLGELKSNMTVAPVAPVDGTAALHVAQCLREFGLQL